MNKVIKALHNRGLHVTANCMEKENKIINYEVIRQNSSKLVAFANKLSIGNDDAMKAHSRTILTLVDEAKSKSK